MPNFLVSKITEFPLSDLKNPVVVEITPLNPSIDKFMCKYFTI